LKEFEELMLDNALLKIQNQTLVDRNPKWKEWCQIMQEIKEEQIQDSLEIAHVDEKTYMFELVAYRIQCMTD
jgi:phage anti-repressor protein